MARCKLTWTLDLNRSIWCHIYNINTCFLHNDLAISKICISVLSKPTLFADDTNIIFTHPNPSEFKVNSNMVFEKITNWFKINLSLNLGKTYYM